MSEYHDRQVKFLLAISKEIKEKFPLLTTELKISEPGSATYSYLYVKGPGVNSKGEFCNVVVPDGLRFYIEQKAEAAHFEIAHFCGVGQHAERDEWLKNNPCPVKPSLDKVDLRTKAGKLAKAKYEADLAKFKVDLDNWRTYRDANQPLPYRPGIVEVSFDELGHADEVMAFYANTKYWGD